MTCDIIINGTKVEVGQVWEDDQGKMMPLTAIDVLFESSRPGDPSVWGLRSEHLVRCVSAPKEECDCDEELAIEPPTCPKCGNNRQVWRNQITARITCHHAGCHTDLEPPAAEELGQP